MSDRAGFPRYAIYYAPAPDHPLHGFGSRVIGYDASSGSEPALLDGLEDAGIDWHQLTQHARKYGFHATLKPPFALASSQTEAGLQTACIEFAAMTRRIPVIVPVVGLIDGFIAVIPEADVERLGALARDCVADFDHFRAPLTEHDRNRRNPSALSPRQRDYLERWGYPYVMEEFRFHMTLTGRLSGDRREAALAQLRKHFAELDLQSLRIDRIVLFRQDDAASRFTVVDQYLLSAAAEPIDPARSEAAE